MAEKQARVGEEVGVRKDAIERTERVQETARKPKSRSKTPAPKTLTAIATRLSRLALRDRSVREASRVTVGAYG